MACAQKIVLYFVFSICYCTDSPTFNFAQVLEIATKAIEFYNYQKSTELQFHEQKNKLLANDQRRIESQFDEKLNEYREKITGLTQQLSQARKERENERKEFTELQLKYNENAR